MSTQWHCVLLLDLVWFTGINCMVDILRAFTGGLWEAFDGQRRERMGKFTESYKKQLQHRGWDFTWDALETVIREMGRVARNTVTLLYCLVFIGHN